MCTPVKVWGWIGVKVRCVCVLELRLGVCFGVGVKVRCVCVCWG